MKHSKLIFGFLVLITAQASFAMTCPQIRQKAAASKTDSKSECILVDHTIGMSPGSSVSTYDCAGKKYQLTTLKNDNCTVEEK